jgi:hypothetical protein
MAQELSGTVPGRVLKLNGIPNPAPVWGKVLWPRAVDFGGFTTSGGLSLEEIYDLLESEREWLNGQGKRTKDAKSTLEWLNNDKDD